MEQTTISKDVIRASYLEQAKLTQAHAWLALGAHGPVEDRRVERLEAVNFSILYNGLPAAGTLTQHAASAAQMVRNAVLAQTWQLIDDDQSLSVDGVIEDPNMAGRYFEARVRFEFGAEPELLPPIKRIDISTSTEARKPASKPDLMGSRLLSCNHRWHTLVEHPGRTPESFQDLMGDHFKMEFGHGSVSSYQEFCEWLRGSASSVNASRHDMESFSWEQLSDGEFRGIFILDWLGLNRDDKVMTAKTKHTWIMSDNCTDPYPKIQHMDVQFLEAFAVVE